jgi:NADH-quinone oxidoreductase subunit J
MDSNILFFLFAGAIVLCSILTVTTRRILRAAVYLLFVLISTAGIYFMLNYNFLAAVQLTVYAGGIIVLIIFSILLTSHISEKARMATVKEGVLSALATGAGALLAIILILNHDFVASTEPAISTDVQNVGRHLVSYGENGYALPFEVISILLLAAMVGAIIVARKENLAAKVKPSDQNQEK